MHPLLLFTLFFIPGFHLSTSNSVKKMLDFPVLDAYIIQNEGNHKESDPSSETNVHVISNTNGLVPYDDGSTIGYFKYFTSPDSKTKMANSNAFFVKRLLVYNADESILNEIIQHAIIKNEKVAEIPKPESLTPTSNKDSKTKSDLSSKDEFRSNNNQNINNRLDNIKKSNKSMIQIDNSKIQQNAPPTKEFYKSDDTSNNQTVKNSKRNEKEIVFDSEKQILINYNIQRKPSSNINSLNNSSNKDDQIEDKIEKPSMYDKEFNEIISDNSNFENQLDIPINNKNSKTKPLISDNIRKISTLQPLNNSPYQNTANMQSYGNEENKIYFDDSDTNQNGAVDKNDFDYFFLNDISNDYILDSKDKVIFKEQILVKDKNKNDNFSGLSNNSSKELHEYKDTPPSTTTTTPIPLKMPQLNSFKSEGNDSTLHHATTTETNSQNERSGYDETFWHKLRLLARKTTPAPTTTTSEIVEIPTPLISSDSDDSQDELKKESIHGISHDDSSEDENNETSWYKFNKDYYSGVITKLFHPFLKNLRYKSLG